MSIFGVGFVYEIQRRKQIHKKQNNCALIIVVTPRQGRMDLCSRKYLANYDFRDRLQGTTTLNDFQSLNRSLDRNPTDKYV